MRWCDRNTWIIFDFYVGLPQIFQLFTYPLVPTCLDNWLNSYCMYTANCSRQYTISGKGGFNVLLTELHIMIPYYTWCCCSSLFVGISSSMPGKFYALRRVVCLDVYYTSYGLSSWKTLQTHCSSDVLIWLVDYQSSMQVGKHTEHLHIVCAEIHCIQAI